MNKIIFYLFLQIECAGTEDDKWLWGYDDENGPEKWPEHFPYCKDQSRPSPINIINKNSINVNELIH